MSLIRRIFFFVITNLAVLVLISLILNIISWVFGVNLSGYGTSYTQLLIFSAVIGFSGSFISLWISKGVAKRAYKIQLITSDMLSEVSQKERLVYDVVENIAQNNHIKMPEVGVYQSPSPNAFATGPTKNRSLVAVSSGLLGDMQPDAIEGVIAHEMAHVLNGDMVTMTLIQGVINTFVVFLSRVVANLAQSIFGGEEDAQAGWIYYTVAIGCDILFGMLASIVVMAFSRHREYRADEGSAGFVGKEKMIFALETLQKYHSIAPNSEAKLATSMITTKDKPAGGLKKLFFSHPPLSERIENLHQMQM